MDEPSLSRRRLLQSSGLAVVGGLAGCLTDDAESETPTGTEDETFLASPLELVPEGVTTVARVDVASLLSATEMRAAINDLMGEMSATDSQVTVETALDNIEENSGLDPRQVTEVVGFGKFDSGSYVGGYLRSEWTEGELLEEADISEGSTRTYNGETIHEQEGASLVDFGEGRYMFGTPEAVEDALDVRSGDLSPVGGEVETAYRSAREGPVRVGFDVPGSLVEGDDAAAQVAEDIAYGHHTLYPTGDGLGFAVTFEATGEEGAADIADQLEAGLVLADQQLDEMDDPDLQERARQLTEQTEVVREGTTVTVRNTDGGGELFGVGVAAVLASFVLGLGDSPTQAAPQVSFSFDYDSAGTLTITHQGGDHVRADSLIVRGELLDATGSWTDLGGSASGDIGGEPAVVAGDRVTVGAESNSRVSIIWESSEGDTSAMLARFEGPDA